MSYPSPTKVPFLQIKVQFIYLNSYWIKYKVFNINTQEHEKPVGWIVKKKWYWHEKKIHIALMRFDHFSYDWRFVSNKIFPLIRRLKEKINKLVEGQTELSEYWNLIFLANESKRLTWLLVNCAKCCDQASV